MTTVRHLHHEAMVIAQDAKLARDAGRVDEARALAGQAFGLELQAVILVPRSDDSEPTRSILCLSAGSLAMLAGNYSQAERILNEGLSGLPTERTRADLYEVLDQVLSEKRQEQQAAEDRSTLITLRLLGDAVGFGSAPSREVTSRITAAESILDRRSRMDQAQPWQPSGPAPKGLQVFDTFVHAFAPGSLEIELELAPRFLSQQQFDGIGPSAVDVVASVISGLQYMQDDDVEQLERTYPDPAYLKHFVTQAREIAPDGEAIKAVEIQGATHSLEFTRQRSTISVPRSGAIPLPDYPSLSLISTGKLVVGDISSTGKNRDTVKLEHRDGRYELFKVTEGLEDLVKSYFGQFVTVELERPKRKRAIVVDVRRVDEVVT